MKKTKLTVAGIALAGVLFVGGTYAFLTGTTSEKKNTFKMGTGISAEIAEPRWDGTCFTGKDINGNAEDCSSLEGFNTGLNLAKTFTPDLAIPKDPTIKNTSVDNPVYVAVTIDYGNGIATYTDLAKFASIDFNTADWTFNANKTVAYYTGELAAGAKTNPVFTQVKILSTATHPDQGTSDNNMKNFEIKVQGYITQTQVDGASGAVDTLNKVFKDLALR